MPFRASYLKPANQPPRAPRSTKDYGRQHQKWRRIVLSRHPICQHPGCTQHSVDADHIIPISRGGARYDLANGQALCRSHHSAKTNRENREPRAMA